MTTINIEPNYPALFRMMLNEAQRQCNPEWMFRGMEEAERLDALRAVQGFLAPLNVAAQAMTDLRAIEEFRNALAEMATLLASKADTLENQLSFDYEEPVPEGGERGLL